MRRNEIDAETDTRLLVQHEFNRLPWFPCLVLPYQLLPFFCFCSVTKSDRCYATNDEACSLNVFVVVAVVLFSENVDLVHYETDC